MPSPRTETKARRGYTAHHVGALLFGHNHHGAFVWDKPTGVPHRSREGWHEGSEVQRKLRKAIDEIGDELLAEWIVERPGTRPWFWWRFIATEPRRDGESERDYLLRFGLLTDAEMEVANAVTT